MRWYIAENYIKHVLKKKLYVHRYIEDTFHSNLSSIYRFECMHYQGGLVLLTSQIFITSYLLFFSGGYLTWIKFRVDKISRTRNTLKWGQPRNLIRAKFNF